MKVVIIAAGGKIRPGGRPIIKPKPMVEIVDLISVEPSRLTYGDSVGDVDIDTRVKLFMWHGNAWRTLTAAG